MKWLTENWDKVLAAVLSAIVGGVIGFFSAIATIDKEIAELRTNIEKEFADLKVRDLADAKTDISLIKFRLEQNVDPKLKSVDGIGDKLSNIEARILVVESQSTFLRTQSEILLRARVGGNR